VDELITGGCHFCPVRGFRNRWFLTSSRPFSILIHAEAPCLLTFSMVALSA